MLAGPLVRPDQPLAVGDRERRVQDWGRRLMRQALTAAGAAQAARRPVGACPACGATASCPAGSKARRIETVFGPVAWPRQRRRGGGCGRHSQPDDAVLAPAFGRGQLAPHRRERAVRCGARWPYRDAAAVLGRGRGIPLAAEPVRAVVGTIGTRGAATQARDAAAAVAPPAAAPAPGRAVPGRLAVERDGAGVHSHDAAHGIAGHVGVVQAGSADVGRRRRQLAQRPYAAPAPGVAACEPWVTAVSVARHGFAANRQTLLGDGAAWSWRRGEELLPDAIRGRDRWHRTEARRRALRAARPDKTGRAPGSARLEARLEGGDVPGALAGVAEGATEAPQPARAAFAGSLTTLARCIPHDAARRAAGERIGSGAIEQGGAGVVNRRLQGRRGRRWWRDRIEGMVALRLAALPPQQ